MEKNPNQPMTVDEFVQSYVSFEEKLKLKYIKLEKILDDITEDKKKDIEGLNQDTTQEEEKREGGLTNKSNLYVSVIEGENLSNGYGGFFLSEGDPYVELSFQDKVERTLEKKNTSNPSWNEDFKFPIENSIDGVLKVEAFDNSFLGRKSLGYVKIQLRDLMDQEKRVQWYDLFNDGNRKTDGKIRLKIQCIISLKKYYQDQIEKKEKQTEFLNSIYEELFFYVKNIDMENPSFSIINGGNLDGLLDKQKMNQCEQLIAHLEKEKENVFSSKSNSKNISQKCECVLL